MNTTLTAREVADMLGQSTDSIYDAVRRGDIPNVGVGRHVRIPRVWLEQRFAQAGVPLKEPVTTIASGVVT